MAEEKELRQFCMGVYRHYKGNYYAVLGLARHSETGEQLVVYIPLYHIADNDGVFMAVRPLSMFMEDVTIGDGGEGSLRRTMQVPRFRYVGPGGSNG
jgi:hypothetical protein